MIRRIQSSITLTFGLLLASSSAFAQAKAEPPPELPPSANPSLSSTSDDSPEPPPAAPAAMEEERGASTKTLKSAVPPSPSRIVMDAPTKEEEPTTESEPQENKPPHKQRITVGIGFRGGVVSDSGYDPYSKDDTLPMFSLYGTFTPWPTKPWSIHLAAEWDYGSTEATARGVPSSLDMHKIGLGLEGRYSPITRMVLLARVLPSAIHVGGTLQDPTFGLPLEANSWTWGVDLTGGAAARVGAVGTNENPSVSFWLGLDMGYRFAGTTQMRFRPGDISDEDKGRTFGEVPLPNVDLSGFIGRFSFSISF